MKKIFAAFVTAAVCFADLAWAGATPTSPEIPSSAAPLVVVGIVAIVFALRARQKNKKTD